MVTNLGIQEDFFSSVNSASGAVISVFDTSLKKVVPMIDGGSVYTPKRVDVFVPSVRMGEFLRRVEKIQGQAVKLGLPQWDVAVGAKTWRLLGNAYPVDLYPGQLDPGPLQIEGSNVSIVGQAPVLDGWRFLAKIEHGDGSNLVKRMVGGDSSPLEWHSCGPNCDHCDVSRARKNTFMLESVETGEIKQVGSTCVSDFLGQELRDPERIATMFDHLMDLEREFEFDPDEELGRAGRADLGVEPARLMAATLKIVEEDGSYLSVEKADSLGCMSTGDRLRSAFWSAKPIVVRPDVGHVERAGQVVDWLKNQKADESLWLRNIAYLSDRPCIAAKDAGLFASGYVAWNRALQKQLRADRGDGDWIGEPGAKILSVVTLDRRGGYENQYGFVSILSFRDEEGNGLVWKTQSPPSGLVVGASYHVASTVKGHGEYNGDKQTEIIRAKVAELELFSFGPLPGFKKMAAMANPDVADEYGDTPLLKAVINEKPEHAKVLLLAGADANQLGQRESPVLAYANSAAMAQVLLDAGARAVDVSPSDLEAMEADARAVLIAAVPDFSVIELGASFSGKVVTEGVFSGPVLFVDGGVVTQKINRAGDVVCHEAARLSAVVEVGVVMDVSYAGGRGVVKGHGVSKRLER